MQFWRAHAAGVYRPGRWPNGCRGLVNSLSVISTTSRFATSKVFGRRPKTPRGPPALPNPRAYAYPICSSFVILTTRKDATYGERAVTLFNPPRFVGRLTHSLPVIRPAGLPVHVARCPAAPFCETPSNDGWRLTQTPYNDCPGSSYHPRNPRSNFR